MFFKDKTYKRLTDKVYKVPLCIQDTIPIYRIAKNGIFELENPMTPKGAKKEPHLFDKMYLFEDINFSTQDEEEKERTGARFETLLRSMNVSYKIIVSNHYADNNRLREAILHSAVSDELEPLAKEYHKLFEDRLEKGRSGLLQSKYFIMDFSLLTTSGVSQKRNEAVGNTKPPAMRVEDKLLYKKITFPL